MKGGGGSKAMIFLTRAAESESRPELGFVVVVRFWLVSEFDLE